MCGRFEGIDQRVIDKHDLIEISIGDYILSGGDLTAFSVTFRLNEEFVFIDDIDDLAYRVTGIYSIPLTIEGPVLEEY